MDGGILGLLIVDAAALALIGILAVNGWRRGLVSSSIGIAGFFIAIWAGARYAPSISGLFGDEFAEPVRFGLSFLVILVGVIAAAALAGRILSAVMNATPLGIVDHGGGAAIGALKGFVLVSVVAIVIALVPVPNAWQSTYMESKTVSASTKVTGFVVRLAQPYVSEPLRQFMDAVDRYIGPIPENLPDLPGSGLDQS